MVADPDAAASIPVAIIGGGPVGLALALELGWRGVRCVLLEQSDTTVAHPRANAINVRTMEFCRRWGVADRVRAEGTPPDYPHTVLYLTSLGGYEVARVERQAHGGGGGLPQSPERPQRCNQIWFDPILRDRAAEFPTVSLRYRCRFDDFAEDADGVMVEYTDLAANTRGRLRASYLIACCGGRSGVRDRLGIAMDGDPVQGYPVDIFFRAEKLWDRHDKSKAALYYLVGPTGQWGTLTELDGHSLWRLTLHGSKEKVDLATLDVEAAIRRAVGFDFPHEVKSVTPWVRRELIARGYGRGRVFIAGDCAHVNSPSGGHGMNTGVGDAVDLGWKLAAMVEGWAGPRLLASYEPERRPVAQRNVSEATHNFEVRGFQAPALERDTPEGARSRAALHERIMTDSTRRFGGFGIALGYAYANSPVVCSDGATPPGDRVRYVPSTVPGARAPHVALPDGRSTIDLFGRGFVLVRRGGDAPDGKGLADAARNRGVPFRIETIDGPDAAALYERRLVLVRPDGHVAWRGDEAPADPLAVIDRVRGG